MWDKLQNFQATKLIFVLCYFFEANFLVLQAKLMKNVPTACLLYTPVTGLLTINDFLPIIFNQCFGCLKEPSH